ncbi:MAG: chloride channel protein [Cyclobacteriaceae bacterium]|nr:chloride channel protein [Cyclobacteriaceae bacterium]
MKNRNAVNNNQLTRVLGTLFQKLTNKQFLVVGAIVVGLWAGLTAVSLKIGVHLLQEELRLLGQEFNWLYVITPGVGILLSLLFVKLVIRDELLRGTSHVLVAIAKKSSFLPSKETFSHAVTSALTVGMGGSAGLESPIVQTGSAIGSTFAALFPLSYRDRTLLLACGAAAGIATAFNAPIAGVLFALEVLLVDVNISAFIPLLIAGATGALCSKIILADGILISFKQTTAFDYHNVPYYVVLGIICGMASAYYIKVFLGIERLYARYLDHLMKRLIIGSMLLGIIILIFPAFFGEGYTSITFLASSSPEQLFTGSPLYNWFTSSALMLGLAVLGVSMLKVFAVSLTLHTGGNGGNFAPALLVGACLGFSFSFLTNLSGLTSLPLANFSLVAMAGMLTGIFHAPLTAVFLIAEITGGYELMIPLMIVAALSTAISRYLGPLSLDEAKLKQANQELSFDKDGHILSELHLSEFLEKDFVQINKSSKLRSLVDVIAHSKRNIFPVINNENSLVGIVALEDIREIMFNTELYDTTSVEQLMRAPGVVAQIDEDMASIMEKFDKTGVWNIPVLQHNKYLGFVSKSRIFSNYRTRLRNG